MRDEHHGDIYQHEPHDHGTRDENIHARHEYEYNYDNRDKGVELEDLSQFSVIPALEIIMIPVEEKLYTEAAIRNTARIR